MGSGRWDVNSRASYRSYADSTVNKGTHEIYSQRTIHPNLDPLKIKIRESRDSAHNPESTPIIVALDVTGSMGILADTIARKGLGTLFESILDKKPVSDPHLMFMAIGDANCDKYPLQVSQFEADASIIEQLTQIYLEGGGGGNHFESYNLPWYFAAFKTVHDAMEKRGKKGFLFTVGDEEAPHTLTKTQIKTVIGDDTQRDIPVEEQLSLCQRVYHTFHIVVEEGSHARRFLPEVQRSWRELLGQNVIPLSDHTKLAETVVSAIQVVSGIDADVVARSWRDRKTQDVIEKAVKSLPRHGGPIAKTA